jgi:hypothetical protein
LAADGLIENAVTGDDADEPVGVSPCSDNMLRKSEVPPGRASPAASGVLAPGHIAINPLAAASIIDIPPARARTALRLSL